MKIQASGKWYYYSFTEPHRFLQQLYVTLSGNIDFIHWESHFVYKIHVTLNRGIHFTIQKSFIDNIVKLTEPVNGSDGQRIYF